MAENGIVREAALRRKKRSVRPLGAEKKDENMEQSPSDEGTQLPTICSQAIVERTRSNTDSFVTVPDLHALRRSRFVDRHIQFRNTSFCLPFILCKFSCREAKVLINTCVINSIINRRFYQDLLLEDGTFQTYDVAKSVPLMIENRMINFDFIIRGDVPDLVLGLDFFTQLECALDFGTRQFIVRKDPQVATPLLCERELPLRYRNGHNLLASF